MTQKKQENQEVRYVLKKAVSIEGMICLIVTFGGLF